MAPTSTFSAWDNKMCLIENPLFVIGRVIVISLRQPQYHWVILALYVLCLSLCPVRGKVRMFSHSEEVSIQRIQTQKWSCHHTLHWHPWRLLFHNAIMYFSFQQKEVYLRWKRLQCEWCINEHCLCTCPAMFQWHNSFHATQSKWLPIMTETFGYFPKCILHIPHSVGTFQTAWPENSMLLRVLCPWIWMTAVG